ncbi:phage major capsid protein [Paenalcaligenes niemegkensis]|uniref:phage major capsid protein n=1 Tax=Paenalcaligenes niemegkensis TaxID=2895469 RepID=UPI001EE8B3DF|nr:phage major capsid protein [Paenalcaligenes niemegkensis]MCQ9615934.1 phage major capsid protein [Paenalcaligenes niemegkensis]
MTTLVEMKQQRAKIASDMRSLHTESGENEFTDEQRSSWEGMKADLKSLDAKIQREEDVREAEQSYVEDNSDDLANKARKASGEGSEDELRAQAFDKFMRHGLADLTPDEKRAMDEARAQAAGVGDKGGYTVPTTFIAKVHESLSTYGGIASVMQVLTTDAGNSIEWPTSDGSEEEGELLGENTAASEQDVGFGMDSMGAHKVSSKVIRVSNELLSDTAIDMETFLAERIGSRIGRTQARLIVKGTGVGTPLQPKGLEASASVGASTAVASKFTWQEVNALIHSVDPGYRNAPKFRLAFNDKTLQAIEDMEDGNKRPLWLPGVDASHPATVLGKQFVLDTYIADVGAGTKFMYAGDFNQFILRQVRYMALKRLVERYAEYDQTGFLAFHRFGCILQDVAAIKALQGKASGG